MDRSQYVDERERDEENYEYTVLRSLKPLR